MAKGLEEHKGRFVCKAASFDKAGPGMTQMWVIKVFEAADGSGRNTSSRLFQLLELGHAGAWRWRGREPTAPPVALVPEGGRFVPALGLCRLLCGQRAGPGVLRPNGVPGVCPMSALFQREPPETETPGDGGLLPLARSASFHRCQS